MKTYTLSNGKTFNTIIIPKGTILFRGIDFNSNSENIVRDLFGTNDGGGNFCVDPHLNKFFYPSPFVSESINKYPIHGIFIINYDIEIVLMVLPSLDVREKKGDLFSPYVPCTSISDKDKCKEKRNPEDPCLSELFIKEYPDIQGYIAIHRKDAYRYEGMFFQSNNSDVLNYRYLTAPFIVANSTGIQSVPEIVLFPYHKRHTNPLDPIFIHRHSVYPNFIEFIIKNRALLNYCPLVYITEKDIYTLTNLEKTENLDELADADRTNIAFPSSIVSNMKNFMDSALSPKGVSINNNRYYFTIDLRTGFFIVHSTHRPKKFTMRRKVLNIKLPSEIRYIPLHYPSHLKKQLHGFLSLSTQSNENISFNLAKFMASYKKEYQFDKGDKNKYKTIYKMELAFPRPDIKSTLRKKYTRKLNKISETPVADTQKLS